MTRVALQAEPTPSMFCVKIDTREQLPFSFEHLGSCMGTLATGDYSIVGLEHVIAIERKGLNDFVSCCAGERDRFQAELKRMLAYETRAVVIEASWADLERGEWRSKIPAQSVVSSALGWIAAGIPIVPAGDRGTAQRYTEKMLFLAARRRWREARGFLMAAPELVEGAA
jgi:ERCC4-type nuclease